MHTNPGTKRTSIYLRVPVSAEEGVIEGKSEGKGSRGVAAGTS